MDTDQDPLLQPVSIAKNPLHELIKQQIVGNYVSSLLHLSMVNETMYRIAFIWLMMNIIAMLTRGPNGGYMRQFTDLPLV